MTHLLTLVAFVLLVFPRPTRAAIHETLFHEGAPDSSLAEHWARHPEPRGYRVEWIH